MVKKTKMGMILVSVLATLSLAIAPAAIAQSSSVGGYGGQAGVLAGADSGGPTDPGGATSNSSSLPFTGIDVSLLIGGGLLLLGIGIVMTRMVPRQDEG